MPRIFILALFLALAGHAADFTNAPTAALAVALTVKGSFSVPRARAGDTVEYTLRVEWRDVPAAVMVLPPRDELKTPGFTVIGQSALHRQTASAGSVRNVSEFSYLLVAREEGQARVLPFSLRYRDGLAGQTNDRIESVPVEGSLLEIGPARMPFLKRKMVQGGAAFLALALSAGLLVIGILAAARRARKRRGLQPEPGDAEDEFTRGIAVLKNRCDAADSRVWLRDAEKLCVVFLCRALGVGKVSDVRFEAALDQYLARHARNPWSDESWTKLRDLFHEARYAGGRKEPHELRDVCRHLKICLSPLGAVMDPSTVKMENY